MTKQLILPIDRQNHCRPDELASSGERYGGGIVDPGVFGKTGFQRRQESLFFDLDRAVKASEETETAVGLQFDGIVHAIRAALVDGEWRV